MHSRLESIVSIDILLLTGVWHVQSLEGKSLEAQATSAKRCVSVSRRLSRSTTRFGTLEGQTFPHARTHAQRHRHTYMHTYTHEDRPRQAGRQAQTHRNINRISLTNTHHHTNFPFPPPSLFSLPPPSLVFPWTRCVSRVLGTNASRCGSISRRIALCCFQRKSGGAYAKNRNTKQP